MGKRSDVKTFVVLGMHRSATSLVAKAVNAEVGFNGASEHLTKGNPMGQWETSEIRGLNEEILKAAGGGWNNPPDESAILQQTQLNGRIETLIRKLSKGQEFWGWKDPRTTLTIRLYLPYLENPHFICCFREPMEVAESLKRRDGMAIKKGLELAKVYNSRLLKFISDWQVYA